MDFGELLASVNAAESLATASRASPSQTGSPRGSTASLPIVCALDGMELLALTKRRKPVERILLCGNLVMDHLFDVASYPEEDTGQRALAARKALGGHAGTTARVLAQLRGIRTHVSLMGTVPTLEDPDTASAVSQLKSEGVDTALLEEVGGHALPTSFILSSQDTGARTIVSTRHGVRELGVEHFSKSVKRAFAEQEDLGKLCWCHLESRQAPDQMLSMAECWRRLCSEGNSSLAESARTLRPLSLEVARPTYGPEALMPLLRRCDYVFFSQEFMAGNQESLLGKDEPVVVDKEWKQKDAIRCLRALRKKMGSTEAVWVCLWGKEGAFALDVDNGNEYYEPAVEVERVVESAHAGDAFIAAFIHSTCRRPGDVAYALRAGNAVAGRKVQQVGFGDLQKGLLGVDEEE
mmetsp:Transcript_38294/g.82839  ORF Transcript_38294/g.82839 Transcript_38294/m.82839 type:complete len:408 (-) Transcript_38294:112-1335(-)